MCNIYRLACHLLLPVALVPILSPRASPHLPCPTGLFCPYRTPPNSQTITTEYSLFSLSWSVCRSGLLLPFLPLRLPLPTLIVKLVALSSIHPFPQTFRLLIPPCPPHSPFSRPFLSSLLLLSSFHLTSLITVSLQNLCLISHFILRASHPTLVPRSIPSPSSIHRCFHFSADSP